MNDSNRFLLWYIDMLCRCKDNEIADFLMNTAYFSDGGQNMDLHDYCIDELVEIRKNIIKSIIKEVSKDIDSELLKSEEYKPEEYDGQINICEKFYGLDIPNKMKNVIIRME